MLYWYAFSKSDCNIIDKLNKLTNVDTFYDDVRKLTKRVYSDHSIGRWQALAEIRYKELLELDSKVSLQLR